VFILRKIFFSRTSKPISIKLGTNHPWVMGILIGWDHFKIFSRTTEPEELIFT
jgi:hypothetical protein